LNLYALSEPQILVFSLVLLRMVSFVFSAAIFSAPMVSTPLRVLFSMILAMSVYPAVKTDAVVLQGFSDSLPLFAIREVAIGLILGFLSRIFFFAVSMVGDVISISLGLSAAQLYNPVMESQGGVVEQFHVILGSLLFLLLNGHHVMITALVQSFDYAAIGLTAFRTGGLAEYALFGGELITLTVKMTAPVMVAILLANVAMGILGRAIPQMNVLVTSFPVTILLGLGTMVICLPLFVGEMSGLIDVTSLQLMKMLKAI